MSQCTATITVNQQTIQCESKFGDDHVGPHWRQTRDDHGEAIRITWALYRTPPMPSGKD